MSLTDQAQELGTKVLDLIFPPKCVHCKKLGEGQLCQTCRAEFTAIDLSQVCTYCGRTEYGSGVCPHCQEAIPAAAPVRSAFVHQGPVQTAIWALKYENRRSLAHDLALALSQQIPVTSFKPIDALCPVPLHVDRAAERGFNQARLIAEQLSRAWNGVPVLPSGTLRRIRHTDSQVGLNYAERQDNVADAFAADPAQVSGKSLILLDDVCTTGATLNASAYALLQAGAARVAAVTVTRAPSPDDLNTLSSRVRRSVRNGSVDTR